MKKLYKSYSNISSSKILYLQIAKLELGMGTIYNQNEPNRKTRFGLS